MTEQFSDLDAARTKLESTKDFFGNIVTNKLDKKLSLTVDERRVITDKSNEYYNYLKTEGFVYGHIAYDVSQNKGLSGKTGNNYLDNAMRVEHPEWSADKRDEVRSGIIARLAYQDADIRGQALNNNGGYITTKTIAYYHYESFRLSGLSREAWIGSAFQEFSGDGHWLFTYQDGIDIQQVKLTEAFVKGEVSNGVDVRKATSYMMHAVPKGIDIAVYDVAVPIITGEYQRNFIVTIAKTYQFFSKLQSSSESKNNHNRKSNWFGSDGSSDGGDSSSKTPMNKHDSSETTTSSSGFSWYNPTDVMISTAIGMEILFEAQNRELVASTQNAANTASNFGRGNLGGAAPQAPTFVPTKGPTGGSFGGGQTAYDSSKAPSNAPIKAPIPMPIKAPTQNYYQNPVSPLSFEPTLFPNSRPSAPNFSPSPTPTISSFLNPLFSSFSRAPWWQPTSTPSSSPSSNLPSYTPISSPSYGRNTDVLYSSFRPFSYYLNSNSGSTSGPLPLYGAYTSSLSNLGRISDPVWLYSRDSNNPAYQQYSSLKASFTASFTVAQPFTGPLGGANLNTWLNGAATDLTSSLKAMPGYAYTQNGYNPAIPAFNAAMMVAARNGAIKSGTYQWTQALQGAVRYAISRVSPLVLDLDGDGIELLSYMDGVYFDIDNDGYVEKIGWTKPDDGQLARDINGNGIIDDITELFGDDLISAFFKLSLLDSNNDRVIDEQDEAFNELLIWQDKNSNGFSEADELKTLKEMGIQSISLVTKPDTREIEGNKISETATFIYEDGREYEIADVHYHNDDMDTWFKGTSKTGKEANGDYRAELKQFYKKLFQALSNKAKNLQDVDKEEDWLATAIKNSVQEFIAEVTKERQKAFAIIVAKAEIILANKQLESEQKYVQLSQLLANKINVIYDDKVLQEHENIRIKEAEQYTKELAELEARYIPEFNKKREELRSVFLTALTAEVNIYTENYNKNIWSLEKTNQEIEAANARVSNECSIQENNLPLIDYTLQAMKKEGEDLLRKYEAIIIEKKNAYTINSDKERFSAFAAEDHLEKHQTIKLKENLQLLMIDWHTKQKEVENKFLEFLSAALKKAANNIYEFMLKEISSIMNERTSDIEEARFVDMLEKAYFYFIDTEADVNKENISFKNWLQATCKNTKKENNNLTEACAYLKSKKIATNLKITQLFNAEGFEAQNYTKEKNSSNEQNHNIAIDPETLFMPLMRGHGQMPSLHIAMTMDSILKAEVVSFMLLKASDLIDIPNKIMNILYQWAGVTNVREDERKTAEGVNIEAKKVVFVEKLTGQKFKQLGVADFVGQHASTSVQEAWDIALIRMTTNLLVQGPWSEMFPRAAYSFTNDLLSLNDTLDNILNAAKSFSAKNALGYDFWVQLGYILSSKMLELNISIEELRSKLSTSAGIPILIGSEVFSLIGDDLDNYIKGTFGSDYIQGLSGNDVLEGGDGSDLIKGGDGDDEIYGGDGIDRLYGDNGNDKIYGGKGRDFMYGGAGSDTMYGEEGDDNIEGGADADYMDGGEGINTLSYGSSLGGVKINLTTGEASGFDAEGDQFRNFTNLGGSDHDDILIGDDKFFLIDGANIVDGGSDVDTAIYVDYMLIEEYQAVINYTSHLMLLDAAIKDNIKRLPFSNMELKAPITNERKGVNVNLITGIAEKPNGLKDILTNIENIEGTHYNDIITGDDNDNVLNGKNGNDVIYGGKGNDIITSGRGHSELHGGEGDDIFIVIIGTADIYGDEGLDAASFNDYTAAIEVNMEQGIINYKDKLNCKFEGIEAVDTTPFNDIVYDSKGNNHIKAEAGDDIIYISDGDDIIEAGSGDDIIYLSGSGEKIILGDSGADKYVIMPGFTSNGKTSVVIGDFSINLDKIDLTNLQNITSFSNLKFEQIEIIEGIDSYSYAVIHIEDNKEIALLGVELSKLNSDNFIFQ